MQELVLTLQQIDNFLKVIFDMHQPVLTLQQIDNF